MIYKKTYNESIVTRKIGDRNIFFDEKKHEYKDEFGNLYKSGTNFISLFSEKFDAEKMSKIVAIKEGVDQQTILERWENKKNQACNYGTMIHSVMENFIKKNEKNEEYTGLYDSFERILKKDLDSAKSIFSEYMLCDTSSFLCGTADLIINHNDYEFSIGDFKTNESIDFDNKYKKHLKFPIEHLSDCNYNKYSLQLSLYSYFYEKETGKKLRKIFILHKIGNEWKYIPCNFMYYEIKYMIKYYTNYTEIEKLQ